MNTSSRARTRKLVGIALFSAIVVILQFLGSFIHLGPFSVSLVLLPIVVGAATYGIGAGTWLGFVFGVVVLISGDAASFLAINPLGTVVTVIAKGTLAGLTVDVLYRLLAGTNKYVATAVSAVACPIVNTGVFLLGCFVFFLETIKTWATGWAVTEGVAYDLASYIVFGLVGGNFLVELLINIILCPVIIRVIHIGQMRLQKM